MMRSEPYVDHVTDAPRYRLNRIFTIPQCVLPSLIERMIVAVGHGAETDVRDAIADALDACTADLNGGSTDGEISSTLGFARDSVTLTLVTILIGEE